MVAGYMPEAFLGDADASALGIITFHRQGKDPTVKELSEHARAQQHQEELSPTQARDPCQDWEHRQQDHTQFRSRSGNKQTST